MDDYRNCKVIGRGKHSTVYTVRKKKTAEYFAIERVDNSQKDKVLQEVRILHSLDHPNVLKLHSWYETSDHLWLVLEYCVGVDLFTLLQQDDHLPEEFVHDLAADLVKALQYIHAQGFIYCDLKPSNILVCENGRTKLCDFGVARRLSDIYRAPSASVPQGKRGTPCYMAPELFEDEGVHSCASDFWALGCVLYESYAGRPPFTGGEFTQLAKSILTDATPPLPENPSRPFVNLINSLLVKNPRERITWSELCRHAFWKSELLLAPLPPQPAFGSMIEVNCKPCPTSPPLSVQLQEMSNNLKELYYSTTSAISRTATFEERQHLSPIKSPPVVSSTCYPETKKSLDEEFLRFINTASKEGLKGLKGIGEKRAYEILKLREASPEPFKQLNDLKHIGLSGKRMKKMMGT